MMTKLLEIRDEGTMIPVLCVDLNLGDLLAVNAKTDRWTRDAYDARRYLLRRCGYPCDGRPNIGITHLSADGKPFWNDPYGWGGRTYPVAHKYIIENWATLKDGDVVDVEFILGEKPHPKLSERVDPYNDKPKEQK